MLVKDIMTTTVVTVGPKTTVAEIAGLLITHRISAVPVVDSDGCLLGIVSEGDLMRRPETDTELRKSWWLDLLQSPAEKSREFVKTHGQTASDIMTSSVITVDEELSVNHAADLLEENRIKRLPVTRHDQVIGIISRANLIQAVAAHQLKSETVSVDDGALRQTLIAHLAEEGVAGSSLINPIVEDGVAHMWGFVGTEVQRKAICALAENVPGIRSVEDHMATEDQFRPSIAGSEF